MSRIWDRLRRLSFATRMVIAFVFVILVPTLFTSFSFYIVSGGIVKQSVRDASIQIAKQGADSLSFMLNAGSDTSDLIYSDRRIQNVVSAEPVSTTDLAEWQDDEDYMKGYLNNIVYSSSFVNIAYVLKDRHTGWGSGSFSKIKLARYDLEAQPWAAEARAKEYGLVWGGIQADQLSSGGDNTEMVLPVGRAMIDYRTMKPIGYVLVNLNGRKVIDKIKEMKLGETGRFFVVNEEGRMMVDADPERVGSLLSNRDLLAHIVGDDRVEFEFDSGGVPYYGVKQLLSNGWLLVGTVPVGEITDRLSDLQRYILLSFGMFTLLGMLIGLVIANRVTKPIKHLTRQMKLVQKGDLTVRTTVNSSDEFGLMSHQFNRMITDINGLMEQVALEQQQKQDAELRAVMHRINPHFLFNTLGTIRWLIKYDQSDKAYEGITALTRLLEANMGRKGNMVTLAEEMDIIEKYLVILEMRYSRHFELTVSLDNDTAAFVIPRMLIQPLVENAIFHGIVPKGTDGRIRVNARRMEEDVIITVEDDGQGMQPDHALYGASLGTAVDNGQTGIGLRHVHESIALHYGGGSNVSLMRGESGGTVARIVLRTKILQQGR